MKKYRETETYFDVGQHHIDESGRKSFVKDGLLEARARLNFFEKNYDGPDPDTDEIILVLKEAIKDLEARR